MRITLDDAEALAFAALRRAGASEGQAGPVARSLRDAEAEGLPNVGLAYLEWYVRHLRAGRILGRAEPLLSRPSPGRVAADAAGGFAHPAFLAGETALVEAAKEQGFAALAVSGAYACGVLGWFVERLASRGLVGLGFANSSPMMAAWGGARPFFGTNPLAFAAPAAGDPLLYDGSAAATAWVNLAEAAASGGPIPEGWALDRAGRPTTDPAEALAGTVAPAGGAKGAGLALMVEVMAGALTGGAFSFETPSLWEDEGGPPRLGQLFLAIRPEPGTAKRIAALLATMNAEPGVRAPGARRAAARRRAEAEGVEIGEALAARLAEMAGRPVRS